MLHRWLVSDRPQSESRLAELSDDAEHDVCRAPQLEAYCVHCAAQWYHVIRNTPEFAELPDEIKSAGKLGAAIGGRSLQ